MTNCKHFNNNQCKYKHINIPCTFHNNENVTDYNELAQEFCKFYESIIDIKEFDYVKIVKVECIGREFNGRLLEFEIIFSCYPKGQKHLSYFKMLSKNLKNINFEYDKATLVNNIFTLSNNDESIFGILV